MYNNLNDRYYFCFKLVTKKTSINYMVGSFTIVVEARYSCANWTVMLASVEKSFAQ